MSYDSKINTPATIYTEEGMMEVKDASTNTTKDKVVEFENHESKRTQRQHYSEAGENEKHENKLSQRQHYSEAGENENHENKLSQRQHYSEAGENENLENKRTQRQHYSEAGENAAEFKDHGNKCTQKRHYSEAGNNVNFPYENFADAQSQVDAELFHPVAAAGIETKIENYDNIRSQRRHYFEGDEMTDATEEIAADVEGAVEPDEDIAEKEEAARVEKKEEATRIEKIEEAARVEKKITEDCEGKPSHRRHFPGSTTSNIFG